MAKKNIYIEDIKKLLSQKEFDVSMVNEEVIPLFVTFFECLQDSRYQPLVHHKLSDIIGIAFFGIIAGCNTWEEIEVFGEYHEDNLKKYLTLSNGTPSHDTFRRVFNLIKPSEFGDIMVMVLEPIISKAVFNQIGKAYIDESNYISDILSLDGKVSTSSSRKGRDKTFVKALNTLHVQSTELGITLISEPIDSAFFISSQISSASDLSDILIRSSISIISAF